MLLFFIVLFEDPLGNCIVVVCTIETVRASSMGVMKSQIFKKYLFSLIDIISTHLLKNNTI